MQLINFAIIGVIVTVRKHKYLQKDLKIASIDFFYQLENLHLFQENIKNIAL